MRKKLTSKIVEYINAPGPRRLEIWDTVLQGFGLRASPNGRKVWFVVVRVNRRSKRLTIGTYPAVSLADARAEAGKIIRDAQLGLLDEAKQARSSLGATVPLFIQLHAKPKTRGWRASERMLRVLHPLFDKPLDTIKRPDIVRILDPMIAAGKPYGANRTLAVIKKLMSWALDRGMIEVNPIAGMKAPAREYARERVLTDGELIALLKAADKECFPFGDMFTLLILTGQRRGEVTGMRWSELDLEGRIWTIPAARAKNGQAHHVPLSETVLDILNSIPRFHDSDLVLTTTGTTPISGFGRAKERLSEAMASADWRTHDLRRTAASGMARLGVPPHVVEKVLNHKTGIISGIAAVYNRYGYEKEKREALELWATHLARLDARHAMQERSHEHSAASLQQTA